MSSEDDVLDTALDALTPDPIELLISALETVTDPLKILKAVLWLGARNDAKARAEFLAAMEDQNVLNAQQVQEVAKRADAHDQRLDEMDRLTDRIVEMVLHTEGWKGDEHDIPTKGDVLARAKQFKRDAEGAGSHGKRKILWNAFRSSFKPEFYKDGWSTHLWRIAEQIEYPECLWLAELIRKNDVPWFDTADQKYFFIRRLEELGLVTTLELPAGAKSPLPRIQVYVSELGLRFKRFVEDESPAEKPEETSNGSES